MNDATDFPVSHDDRSRTNSIRGRDALRNESLPGHARAYRAGPPFSTFQREGSGLASSQKYFAYFLAPLILAALNICLNIGCERVHVDRFSPRFLVSWNPRALDDYAMTEPSPMDKAFMARAIQLSLENVSSGRGGPFGTVIVKEGIIVAESANQVTAMNDPTAHV